MTCSVEYHPVVIIVMRYAYVVPPVVAHTTHVIITHHTLLNVCADEFVASSALSIFLNLSFSIFLESLIKSFWPMLGFGCRKAHGCDISDETFICNIVVSSK